MQGQARQLESPGTTLGEMYENALRENRQLRIIIYALGHEFCLVSDDLRRLCSDIVDGEPPR